MRLQVCIPSFEYPIGVERALQSLTLQTFRDFSVVVSDDSASNAVRDVVRGFEQKLPLTYVRNSPPRGMPGNWDAWVGAGDSEYVQLLHHDDWLAQPDSLAKLVEALDNAPEAAFAFCNSVDSRADGSPIKISRPWRGWEERLAAMGNRIFMLGNFVGAPSAVVFRRQTQARFDHQLKWVVDVDFYAQMLAAGGKVVHVDEPLVAILTEGHARMTSACIEQPDLLAREYMILFRRLYGLRWPGFEVACSLVRGINVRGLSRLNGSLIASAGANLAAQAAIFYLLLHRPCKAALQRMRA
jgi:glycosyltransferase involved in cell wall biosynthesis